MKKTIAKFMAAAMLLSAVPAVTLPTFVSKAQDTSVSATSATSVYNVFNTSDAGTTGSPVVISSKGIVTQIILDKDVRITKSEARGSLADIINITTTQVNGASGVDSDHSVIQVKASLKANMTSQLLSSLLSKIKSGDNTFNVYMEVAADAANVKYDAAGNPLWAADVTGKLYSKNQYRYGGVVTTGAKVESGIFDSEALLNSGDVYAKIGNLSTTNKDVRMPEVEILQGVKGQLRNNDALRGNTLDLNTVWIQGLEYKVTKLGSQALKEAHMKKLLIKNVTQIGKGALRKCKNVRKVNASDKNKVRKIRSKAFYDCKNLKHINIDGRKLKEIGKDAFGKVKKNCVIKFKASKSKYNEDVKKAKKSGAKNVKYARIAP